MESSWKSIWLWLFVIKLGLTVFAACANCPTHQHLGFGYSSRQGGKHAKFGKIFWLLLCVSCGKYSESLVGRSRVGAVVVKDEVFFRIRYGILFQLCKA